MEYPVPASVTLNGVGMPWNTTLSDTDKAFVRLWYPFPVTPQNAAGLLRTGDDCDEIDFVVEYGVVDASLVTFRLGAASGLNWWKAIEVPVGPAGYMILECGNGVSAETPIPRTAIDVARPIRFHKATLAGDHTLLGYTWDVLTALPGGSRLTLTWKRDRC